MKFHRPISGTVKKKVAVPGKLEKTNLCRSRGAALPASWIGFSGLSVMAAQESLP